MGNKIVGVLQEAYGRSGPPDDPNSTMVIGYSAWCPACEMPHTFMTSREWCARDSRDCWDFDGNFERPTFAPSMGHNLRGQYPDDPKCHSFLRDGQWQFLGDCTHSLAGQTVAVPPYPDPEPPWRPWQR